jgi:GDP-4-dehydro-6-deoxy-D-mannose reductase
MKTILLTGSEGFVGSYLLKLLKETLNKIVPVCYPLLRPKRGKYFPLDIMNLEMTRAVVKSNKPDVIFHLAAVSSVAKSFRDRPLTYGTNITGTMNLLEAAQALGKPVRFVLVSTCEVYGGGENLAETAPILLRSPYAVSKYAAELVVRDYAASGIEFVILRPFNHTGPGQSDDFVLPTIARQIAEIEKGKRPPLIEVGNTDIRREFMNVADVVQAYILALDKGTAGETYNIASGSAHALIRGIDILKGLARVKFEVKTDPTRIRKSDIPILTGNGKKFSQFTGWQAKIPFTKTLEDLLNFWRAQAG